MMQIQHLGGMSAGSSLHASACWVYNLPRVLLVFLLVQSWSVISRASGDGQQTPESNPLLPRRLTDLRDVSFTLDSAVGLPDSADATVAPDREAITGVVRSIATLQSKVEPAWDSAPESGGLHKDDSVPSAMRRTLSSSDADSELSTEDRVTRLRASFERNRHPWGPEVDAATDRTPVSMRKESWLPDAEVPVQLPSLDRMIEDAGVATDRPFLFIGVLSSRRTYRRRVTVRNTWLQYIKHMPTKMVDVKFVLSPDEVNEWNEEEDDDVLYVNAAVTYSTILIKVFVMMEHALKTGARWLLKTDDDAYVNVPQTNLLKLCKTKECDQEAKYVGTFIGGSPVFMDAKHKWHNQAYIMHASVRNYLPYALGGGYILSADILKVLVTLHRTVSLTFTPIEDATVGMWVAPLNVTRVNWEGAMQTAGWTCCFTRSTHRDKRNEVLGRYTLSADPCRPMRVERKIHMNEAIQQLLERSAQAQAEEIGHSLSLSVTDNDENGDFDSDTFSDDDAQGGGAELDAETIPGLRGGSEKRKRASRHSPPVLATVHAEFEGEQRSLRALTAVFDEVSALRHQNLNNHNRKVVNASEALQNLEKQSLASTSQIVNATSLFFRSIEAEDYMSDGNETFWRSRPMVMHKVANPLHLYYLHWRLQHCTIPKADLLSPEAVALARSSMPSAREIFQSTPQLAAATLDENPADPGAEAIQDLASTLSHA